MLGQSNAPSRTAEASAAAEFAQPQEIIFQRRAFHERIPVPSMVDLLLRRFVHRARTVSRHGSNGCYTKIQTAVNHAPAGAIIRVASGDYDEQVTIGVPLSLLGAGADSTIIDGVAHGVFVDGFDHPGLSDVNIIGFTIKNALFERGSGCECVGRDHPRQSHRR